MSGKPTNQDLVVSPDDNIRAADNPRSWLEQSRLPMQLRALWQFG